MLETNENRLILIDGGTKEESKLLEQQVIAKGGVVEAWFITNNYEENAGALIEIINSGKVQINNIYVSLNTLEWYQKYEENLDGRKEFAEKFLNILELKEIRDKVFELELRQEIAFDNLNFKILKIKSPEYIGKNAGKNQNVIIKITNNFKNIICLGHIGEETKESFINNNIDEIKEEDIRISYDQSDLFIENKPIKIW